MADQSTLGEALRRLRAGRAGRAKTMPRAVAALLAGAVAIVLNTAVLAAADLVPLATAHGGLLRLLVILTGGAVTAPASAVFRDAFHIVVGLAMALFYAFALEPVLRGPSWLRGLLYAVATWLAKASRRLLLLTGIHCDCRTKSASQWMARRAINCKG